ncbi:uncharacterized protein B0P05DRAFT_338729 [Gilbertella persicaria]|uniref:uncharacterized protein n=1 Tax=Gilbertella persicaria TaxID=101096 RepID=UPI0022204C2E|nr:uncharacterized protein B0P05DRAFT_338729 [Gilbertella persicaria]KAI8048769.1 hypothetical protein B0P05DRAFT_338729 [Gilbertella persicaria]
MTMEMKSVRLYFRGKKFDDQYTFDLQNNLTVQDFCSIVALFNEAARKRSPPGSTLFWVVFLIFLWLSAATSFYLLWIQFNNPYILVALPAFMIISFLATLLLHRNKRIKFEESILQICSQLNATENIRGINFRFSKNSMDVTPYSIHSLAGLQSVYAIDIEFDDRYVALKSRQFNRRSPSGDNDCITSPKQAYVNYYFADEKDPHCNMFQEPLPSWSPPYSEKMIHHLV